MMNDWKRKTIIDTTSFPYFQNYAWQIPESRDPRSTVHYSCAVIQLKSYTNNSASSFVRIHHKSYPIIAVAATRRRRCSSCGLASRHDRHE